MITSFASLVDGETEDGETESADAPNLDARIEWGTPLPLSDRGVDYIKHLEALPKKGPRRLAFFQQYFEDDDPLLRQDAYDEFARAPYGELLAFGDQMDHQKLIGWIDDQNVGPSSRRLYLTMLGVCGQPEDVAMLEKLLNFDYQQLKPAIATTFSAAESLGFPPTIGVLNAMIKAEERRKKESLDALIACYLKLKGPEGLELVNRRFLANPNVSYQNMYSAIMALRFHGEETDVLPREDLLASMRLVLDHPKYADQVVTDLTRWEDWEILPRLVSMFKQSDEDAFIRLPVASYLQVAADQPGEVGEQAQAAIDEFRELDPDTMKRAESPLAFNLLSSGASRPPATDASKAGATKQGAAKKQDDAVASDQEAASSVAGSTPKESSSNPAAAESVAEASRQEDATGAPLPLPTEDLAKEKETSQRVAPPLVKPPSRLAMLGVFVLAGLTMFGVFAVLLRGSDPRSGHEPDNES